MLALRQQKQQIGEMAVQTETGNFQVLIQTCCFYYYCKVND